jgi:hypothetical protein
MLNFMFFFVIILVALCIIAAYAYLIVISRENEMPDFEDVDVGQDENS